MTMNMPTPSPANKSKAPKVWLITGAVLIGLCCAGGAIIVAGSDSDAPTMSGDFAPTLSASAAAKPTGTPAPAKPATPTIDDGTWTVDVDIPAGTYKVGQPISGGRCYWAITKTGSNGRDIIANDLPSGGRPSVTLKAGQDFETARCGVWFKTN